MKILKILKTNIENILNRDAKKYRAILYIYFFDGKNNAKQYLNNFINQNNLKKRFKGLYHSLGNATKESIDINVCEFSGANTIKFAYLNEIKIKI
ncbi:hypothetical protein [Fusobacterium animalis]|uniref:hypothetical protein n=1 Tax=Fusobacterium animalis TaxID=76859 RepID=UPI0002137AA1|nr:hypothetical protein [Fusobacterium animalis]EGN63856.1 hypothetical protein HMPREF0404_01556 [Fusobacterium animalis 21_1A]